MASLGLNCDRKNENCPHGKSCYRRNPHHFKQFEHPHLIEFLQNENVPLPNNLPQPANIYREQLDVLKTLLKFKPKEKTPDGNLEAGTSKRKVELNKEDISKTSLPVAKKSKVMSVSDLNKSPEKFLSNSMQEKLKKAHPYNIFFTIIPESSATFKEPNAISFTDLLCPSLGVLKCSLQLNFMIDIEWLMQQYEARNLNQKPLTILYGYEFPSMEEYMKRFLPNVTYHQVKMKDPFGTHHSKVGIYVYEDESIRVVVSTANLYYEDWNHYNQGLWLSPACPKLSDDSPSKGESKTGFKASLLQYLKNYKVTCVQPWIDYVENADFSEVKVFLITSVPGKHYPDDMGSHMHRVAKLLKQHCNLPAKTTPDTEGPLDWGVLIQASSIGSLGKSPGEWLRGTLLRSLSAHTKGSLTTNSNASVSVVYPSVENVMTGYFGKDSGGCLPYSKDVNEKQKWFQSYLHQWRSDGLQRTRAMPHIKTYCRVSPCLSKLAYFLLTSANLSKSAWGSNLHKDMSVYIRSYEVGVMFLPSYFNEEHFEISKTSVHNKNENIFPFIYDLPLIAYKTNDYPWCN